MLNKIKNISKKTLLIILGFTLGAGFSAMAITYTEWSNEEGTGAIDWIMDGAEISAENLIGTFEYLFDTKADKSELEIKADKPLNCRGENKALQYENGIWYCENVKTGDTVVGPVNHSEKSCTVVVDSMKVPNFKSWSTTKRKTTISAKVVQGNPFIRIQSEYQGESFVYSNLKITDEKHDTGWIAAFDGNSGAHSLGGLYDWSEIKMGNVADYSVSVKVDPNLNKAVTTVDIRLSNGQGNLGYKINHHKTKNCTISW